VKQGGLPEWSVDDGQTGTGAGTLSVTVLEDGTATGSAEGPLGKQTLHGHVDGDSLSLRAGPEEGEAAPYAGAVQVDRQREQLVGWFKASTTDGHLARDGTVTLRRTAR